MIAEGSLSTAVVFGAVLGLIEVCKAGVSLLKEGRTANPTKDVLRALERNELQESFRHMGERMDSGFSAIGKKLDRLIEVTQRGR